MQMSENERSNTLLALNDELLKGGVILSEWSTFLTRESDTAYVKGVFLASILTALSAIETHLRSEYPDAAKMRLVELIDDSDLDQSLVRDLHILRKYQNKWVHVSDPWDDQALIENPTQYDDELERIATLAIRA
jgi:hypothetical protein